MVYIPVSSNTPKAIGDLSSAVNVLPVGVIPYVLTSQGLKSPTVPQGAAIFSGGQTGGEITVAIAAGERGIITGILFSSAGVARVQFGFSGGDILVLDVVAGSNVVIMFPPYNLFHGGDGQDIIVNSVAGASIICAAIFGYKLDVNGVFTAI